MLYNSNRNSLVTNNRLRAQHASIASAYLEKFLRELVLPIALYNDSQGAHENVKNQVDTSRTKQIDIRSHYIKHKLQDGLITLKYLAAERLVAGYLAKPVPKA